MENVIQSYAEVSRTFLQHQIDTIMDYHGKVAVLELAQMISEYKAAIQELIWQLETNHPTTAPWIESHQHDWSNLFEYESLMPTTLLRAIEANGLMDLFAPEPILRCGCKYALNFVQPGSRHDSRVRSYENMLNCTYRIRCLLACTNKASLYITTDDAQQLYQYWPPEGIKFKETSTLDVCLQS